LNSDFRAELSAVLALSDADLFRQIGMRAYVYDGQVVIKKSFGDPDDEQNGRRVFDSLLPRIRAVLCDQWRGCEKLAMYPDESALALVIADTYFTNKIAPLPVATLAVLTVRIGVKRICNCPG